MMNFCSCNWGNLDNWGQQNKTSIVKITLIKYLIYLQLQLSYKTINTNCMVFANP